MYKIVNKRTGRKVFNKLYSSYEAARKTAIRYLRKNRSGSDRKVGYPTLAQLNWSVSKAA